MKRIFPIPLAIAALAILLTVRAGEAFFGGGGGVREGSMAPSFTGQTIDNQQIDYAKLKGKKVIVLDFWSIYCASCIEEMPSLIAMYNEFRDKGLLVIGVNLDSFGTHRVVKFLDGMETKINFPVVIDKNRLIAQSFSAMVLPTTLLIDANGKIRFYHVGYRKGDEKSLRNVVAQAVKEIKK